MTLRIKLVCITLILFITGCTEKDEFTRPVNINLKISFIRSFTNYFEFTEGRIGVQRIRFEGKREAGGDVFFETDTKADFPTLEFVGQQEAAKVSSFEIPQGIYTNMKWDINLKEIVNDELIYDDDTDSLNKGLIIKGDYLYDDWWIWGDEPPPENWIPSIPFIFSVDYTERFSFSSFFPDPNSNEVLTDNKDYEVILLLNLAYAFDSISRESFEEAEISGDSEHPVVIISSNKNKYLYEIILHRLDLSTSVYVY